MKLLVYYSYTGNTELLVSLISNKLNCDVLKLETNEPYSTDYEEVVEQAKADVENNYMPKLKSIIDLEKYDTIIIGSPVWWYTFASPINTFLHENDLSNKTIIPFITNAGWLGHTLKDIEKICSNVKNAISIKFREDKLVDGTKFKE